MRCVHRPPGRALIALGAVFAVALVAPGGAGARGDAGRLKPVDVTFVDKKGIQVDRTDCNSKPGVCELYYHGSGTISGDATGTATYHGHGHTQPGGSFAYRQVVRPTETRGVCGGAGSFKFIEENTISSLDPPQLGLAGIGAWRFVPHSGTGSLKGATGAGFIVVVVHNGIQARLLGAITCRPTGRHERRARR
jgi:hypothetical protein